MAVSYWCVPCAEDAADYTAVIKSLAEAQGAPVFPPHLTLGTLDEKAADPGDVIEALKGLTLAPAGVDGTDQFTLSLFVRFAETDALLTARRRLEALPGFRAGRAFEPHISLCYGPPPEGRARGRDVQALLRRPVRFAALVAMNISLPVETYSDVAAWTLAETHGLPAT